MQMLIASRLTDGQVVFLTERGDWTNAIEAGAVASSPEVGARLLALAERSGEVVDPYLIDVITSEGRRRPAALREAIRAFGPSVFSRPAHVGG